MNMNGSYDPKLGNIPGDPPAYQNHGYQPPVRRNYCQAQGQRETSNVPKKKIKKN